MQQQIKRCLRGAERAKFKRALAGHHHPSREDIAQWDRLVRWYWQKPEPSRVSKWLGRV
jgi:hypothetical protein